MKTIEATKEEMRAALEAALNQLETCYVEATNPERIASLATTIQGVRAALQVMECSI